MSHDHLIHALRSAAVAAIGAMSLAMLAFVSPAAADDEITYGDVRSHFHAAEGAGSVIEVRAGLPASELAGPSTFFAHGIRPFAGTPWDGSSVCEEDWQLLVFALIAAALEGEPPVTRTEGVALLEPLTVDLYLDGVRLDDTERTAIKRLITGVAGLGDGTIVEVTDGWWVQTGAIFAPGELAVGSHTFGVVIIAPGVGDFALDPITFEVDATGTGSCV